MTTSIHVVGTVATEPKMIHATSGTQLCSFRLASDERRYDKETQSWVDPGSNWFGVVAFRTLGAHAHESLHKGDRVMVSGRLRMRNWEKDDRRGVSIEIEADALGHDVRWGVSSFEKRVKARPETAVEGEDEAPLSDEAELTSENEHPVEQSDSPESIDWVAAA